MAETKIVKTLRFPNSSDNYQINAVRTQGQLKVGSKTFNGSEEVSITATDIGLPEATDTWVFDCGTATKVIN